MCGVFGEPADNDFFVFDIEEESWIRIWVRATELGSFANPRAFLLDADDSSFSASFVDVLLVGPRPHDQAGPRANAQDRLLEQEDGITQWGPDYYWRMRVSIRSRRSPGPLKSQWTDGDDFNNSSENPDILNDGDRVWAPEATTNDWYAVDIGDERTEVVVQTDSWSHGFLDLASRSPGPTGRRSISPARMTRLQPRREGRVHGTRAWPLPHQAGQLSQAGGQLFGTCSMHR